MTDCEDCLEYQFLTVLKQNAEYLKSIAESLETIAAKPPITIQIRSPVGVEIATEEEGQ